MANLKIGATNDHLEREADAVANSIMRMPESGLIQRKCTACDEEEKIHRKPHTNFVQKKGAQGNRVASEPLSNQIRSSSGKGRAIPQPTRSFMENRFNADFSNINIHTGSEAAHMSQELGAKAFTVGNDIYFNSSQFLPGTHEGKHLLAHELAHTMQPAPFIQKQAQPQPSPGFHPDVNIDPRSAEVILTYARRALGNFSLRGELTEPLNILSDATGISLGLPPSTLDVSLAYTDRCNRALQNFFIRVNQRQAAGQPVFDFSQANWSPSVGAGMRIGGLLIDASGSATFNGDQFQALSIALTFTSGVSEVIPDECRNTRPTDSRDPSTPGEITLNCREFECSAPITVANLAMHRLCCIGPRTPATPEIAPMTIYFFYDTPVFKPESNSTLSMVLDAMRVFTTAHIRITGHTSMEGTDEYNQRLSERRAQAVRAYLELQGIDPSRIHILAMGEHAPAVLEPAEPSPQSLRMPGNEAIRDLNRRAEVILYDPTGTNSFLPSFPPFVLTLPTRHDSGARLLPPFQLSTGSLD